MTQLVIENSTVTNPSQGAAEPRGFIARVVVAGRVVTLLTASSIQGEAIADSGGTAHVTFSGLSPELDERRSLSGRAASDDNDLDDVIEEETAERILRAERDFAEGRDISGDEVRRGG